MEGALFIGIQIFCILCLLAFGGTVIGVTREHLADVDPVCYQYGYYYQCIVWVSGCLATVNYTDFKPCNYAYTVGSIALFAQIVQLACQFCSGAAIGNLICGIFDLIWWCIAASYFTDAYNDTPDAYPQDYWRHVNMAIMWSATSISAVQIVASVLQCMAARKGGKKGKEYHEEDSKREAAAA